MILNKKFIKYGLITLVLTYSAVFISVNYKKNNEMGFRRNMVRASLSEANGASFHPELVAEGTFFTPCLNNDGTKLLYSSGDDIYELDLVKNDIKQITVMGNCYNPVYFNKDNNLIAFARNDGIYTLDRKSNTIKKVVSSKDSKVSYAKPNFTPEGDIVYFKVTVIPREDGHGFKEESPSICKISKESKEEVKLLEGYNPLLSKDGKTLIYEKGDGLYSMNLNDRKSSLIDEGKYASLSNSGKYISYARFDRNTAPYTRNKSKKNLFIDREYSNIFITETSNSKNKYRITKEEFENRDKEIEDWAKETKDNSTEQHFLVVSKIAYFDSVWSKDDSEIYMSVYNSDKGAFELIKCKVNNK